MYAERDSVTVVTAADGTGTGYSKRFTGRLVNIIYTADGTIPFAAGVDFTITAEVTGQTLWTELNVNATKTVAPRQSTHSTAGVASLYAAAGSAVEDGLVLADDRVKIVIAQGGSTKQGNFIIVVA